MISLKFEAYFRIWGLYLIGDSVEEDKKQEERDSCAKCSKRPGPEMNRDFVVTRYAYSKFSLGLQLMIAFIKN